MPFFICSMEWQPVTSSFIEALAHDPEQSVTHVKMRNGREYSYSGVSRDEHDDFQNAESVGTHYNAHIKGRQRVTR